ncbi:hypothetical protein J3R30DRAFT_3686023 [Lentinula aciculospora]|uniref:Transmembrane protein n=1 Tax=Lentinula aciculospora TaxID=153920 RepID=A0A9W9A1I2_9AGAR|nr:hypothetical protein J3R30DRAFT_3686023 [Lentinula aciculospora]
MSPLRMKDTVLRSLGLFSLFITTTVQMWMFSIPTVAPTPAYSINPFFLYLAFLAQIFLQLWWLLRASLRSALAAPASDSFKEDAEPLLESSFVMPSTRDIRVWDIPTYLPYYILGNLCISAWAIACQHNRISLAQISLLAAIIVQLRVVLSTFNNVHQRSNIISPGITLLVSKTSLCMSVMYLWRTWGLIDHFSTLPSFEQRIHSGVVFLLLTVATGPDPTVGLAFIYILLSLYFGAYQNSGWHSFFVIESVVLAVLLALDSIIIRLGFKPNTHIVNDGRFSETQSLNPFEDNEESSTFLQSPAPDSSKDDIPMLPLHRQQVFS